MKLEKKKDANSMQREQRPEGNAHPRPDVYIRKEERLIKHEWSAELQILEEERSNTKNIEEEIITRQFKIFLLSV